MSSLSLFTSTPATQLGRTFAYWPARSGTSTIYEGQLGHGLTAPVPTPDPPAGTSIQKNTPTANKVPASWANVSDADGDPVAVGTSTSAPPPAKVNGQVSGTTYTPPADFAGTAFVVVSATDGLNSTTVSHRMVVFDTPPQWLSSTTPVVTGKEGTNGITVALAAIDADPNDTVSYSASLPPELANHQVTFSPDHGPASTMTINLPRGYRPGTATIKIHARDTTPAAGGDSVATLFLNVIPSYAAPTVNVQTITTGTAAELDFHDAAWSDPLAPCVEAGVYCHYHFEYSIDNKPAETTTLLYSPARTYSVGTHSFKVRVWISTQSGNTPISPVQSGQFAITVDPRKALKVRAKRSGRHLKVSITALYAGTVRVSLYTRGKRRSFREITFSRTVLSGSVTLPLAGIRVRTGTLTLAYSGSFQAAGGAPQPLVRRVWFR
jgi:hypothetical protein